MHRGRLVMQHVKRQVRILKIQKILGHLCVQTTRASHLTLILIMSGSRSREILGHVLLESLADLAGTGECTSVSMARGNGTRETRATRTRDPRIGESCKAQA